MSAEPTHVPVAADSFRRLDRVIRHHFPIGSGGQVGDVLAAAYAILLEAEATRVALGGGEPFGVKP